MPEDVANFQLSKIYKYTNTRVDAWRTYKMPATVIPRLTSDPANEFFG